MPAAANTIVRMQTDLGSVEIELFDTVAPETVENFLNYVQDGDYDGTFIHRNDPDFVLQMGAIYLIPIRVIFLAMVPATYRLTLR